MRRLARAAALGVGRQRLLQLVGEAEVVDDQPAGLVLEHAVHPRDRLHQPVPAHRLVDVHRVQARRVEAGQPHVAHDHDLERVVRVVEPLGQRLAARLVADVRLPVERVGRRAGHHDLERALARRRRRATSGRSVTISLVQLDADPPAHADDHRLAVHRLEPLLEVLDQVARRSSLIRFSAPTTASSCAHLRLELLLALDLLALGRPPRTRGRSSAARTPSAPAWPAGSRSRSAPWRRPRPPAGCRRR